MPDPAADTDMVQRKTNAPTMNASRECLAALAVAVAVGFVTFFVAGWLRADHAFRTWMWLLALSYAALAWRWRAHGRPGFLAGSVFLVSAIVIYEAATSPLVSSEDTSFWHEAGVTRHTVATSTFVVMVLLGLAYVGIGLCLGRRDNTSSKLTFVLAGALVGVIGLVGTAANLRR
jgi:hypothetical protein